MSNLEAGTAAATVATSDVAAPTPRSIFTRRCGMFNVEGIELSRETSIASL